MFLAFDYVSVRSFDRDGRLRVARANISRATVNPYLGAEIPGAQALGLDPNRVYQLHRPAAELAAAAASFNSIPLLARHVPVDVDDHRPDDVVGCIGSDARFEAPFLSASLIVWAASAIRGIESGAQRALSAAYRYTPIMRAGVSPEGEAFDGVMTGLSANHVALVAEGRAGPDVVVGDGAIVSDAAKSFHQRYPQAGRIKICG